MASPLYRSVLASGLAKLLDESLIAKIIEYTVGADDCDHLDDTEAAAVCNLHDALCDACPDAVAIVFRPEAVLTIKLEREFRGRGATYVARDANRDWHAYTEADPVTNALFTGDDPLAMARHLFHAEEIESARRFADGTIRVILA